ncbi:MAG: hypothetical protein C5B51_22885 [Terriglobia bacterium]|nr:MAG: hypothetical protein C5B51_22885 [Terriglobia bacterium]
MFHRGAILILAGVLLAAGASAQSTAGFAAISGVVRDATGATVPAARITVSNESKGITRNLTATDAGLFVVPNLPPGPGYRVTVAAQGFSNFEASNLELAVGQNVDIAVALAVETATTRVEVIATAPLVEDTKTDVSQVVTTQQIQDLPINGRRVDSFVLLTPGVSNDGYFGNLTFRGMPGNASFLIDGVDNTEQFFGENGGRTRAPSGISQDAVQEFQVVSSNFSPEFGRTSAGVVNTVTRSGTNDLHGTAYWFFRNRTLDARDRYAAVNPPEVRHQTGGTLGGPIKKDKLFFLLNSEIQRRNFPIIGSLSRPTVVNNSGQSFINCPSSVTTNGVTETPTAAQCAAINTLLPRFFGLIPRRNDQETAFGKLDYHPGERNAFSASFNFVHFVAPNGIQSGVAINTGSQITSNGDDSVRVRNGRWSWIALPRNNLVNEFRFGWFTDRQADDFDPGVQTAGLGYLQLSVGGQNLGAGASYLPRVNPREQRFQFADGLSWTVGRHSFKFGVDIASTEDYVYSISNAFGSYSYGSAAAFALDFSGNPTGAKHWQSYSQTFGNPVVDFTIHDNAFYVQDQYRPWAKLTINYGLRYEYAVLPQPKIVNPDYPQTGRIPTGTRNLEPRIGIAYSLDDKTVIRVGYGIYHQRYTGVLVSGLFTNNAVYQKSLNLTSSQYSLGPGFPNVLASADQARAGTTVEFAAPDLRTPYTEQGTLAVERQLGKSFGLTVSYLWNRGVQGFGVRDLNIGSLGPPVTYQIADPNGNIVGSYSTPTYRAANKVDPRYSRILQVENGVNSYYNALVVQARRRFAAGFQANLSWTWSHEIDYKQGSYQDNQSFGTINSFANTFNGDYKFDKGSGLLDQRHRLTISFIESPTFVHRNGAFYKYAVNNWELSGIVTLAAGRPTVAGITVSDSTPFAGAAFTSTLNGYGGNNRPPFWPYAAIYTPAAYRADLRLSKKLPLTERYLVYLNFEAFNVTNSQYDTSQQFTAYVERGGVLTYQPSFGQGSATAGFPDGTNARRAQVSARFVF